MDYSPEEFLEYRQRSNLEFMKWLSPKVPLLLIRKRDGSVEIVDNGEVVKVADAPMPTPDVENMESHAPVEDEN